MRDGASRQEVQQEVERLRARISQGYTVDLLFQVETLVDYCESSRNSTSETPPADPGGAAIIGGVIGGLVGLLAGPLGAAAGAAIGAGIGGSSASQPSERSQWAAVLNEAQGLRTALQQQRALAEQALLEEKERIQRGLESLFPWVRAKHEQLYAEHVARESAWREAETRTKEQLSRHRQEAERRRLEAEARRAREAAEEARREAERQAQLRKEAQERAQREAERRRQEAERQRQAAEEQARRDAERRAQERRQAERRQTAETPARMAEWLSSLDQPGTDPTDAELEDVLRLVTSQQVIDAVCANWYETRDRRLGDALCSRGWIASRPVNVRIATAIAVGRTAALDLSSDSTMAAVLDATEDQSDSVRGGALALLTGLSRQSSIDAVCQRWMRDGTDDLGELLVRNGYVASGPPDDRVLSAIHAGRVHTLAGDGPETITRLLDLAACATPEERGAIADCLRCLKDQQSIDALCGQWESTRSEYLDSILLAAGYVASRPSDLRVLTAMHVGNAACLTEDGPETTEALLRAWQMQGMPTTDNAYYSILAALLRQDAIDLLCAEWLADTAGPIRQLITAGSYVASSPPKARVLSALLVGAADVLADSDPTATGVLVDVAMGRVGDDPLRDKSLCALRGLRRQDAIDAFCSAAEEPGAQQLLDLQTASGYVASAPPRLRVLTALRANKPGALGPLQADLVAPLLAAAHARDLDPVVRQRARVCLDALPPGPAVDQLCRMWAKGQDPRIGDVIRANRYVATGPPELRVLTMLHVGAIDALCHMDTHQVQFVLAALDDGSPEVRETARQALIAAQRDDTRALLSRLLVDRWLKSRDLRDRALISDGRFIADGPAPTAVWSALICGATDLLSAAQPERLPCLLAAADDGDPELAQAARAALAKLTVPDTVRELCDLWVRTRQPVAEEAIASGRYAPSLPLRGRAMCALLSGRHDTLGGAESVPVLLDIGSSESGSLRALAHKALANLGTPDAQVELCKLGMAGDETALRLAVEAGYASQLPMAQQAVLLFLAGQWHAYETLDFDGSLLQSAYSAAGPELQEKLRTVGRREGRTEWVNAALLRHGPGPRSTLGTEEWQDAIRLLVSQSRWRDLWRVGQTAPPALSVQALQELGRSGWRPDTSSEAEPYSSLVELACACDTSLPGNAPTEIGTHDDGVTDLSFAWEGDVVSLSVSGEVSVWGTAGDGAHWTCQIPDRSANVVAAAASQPVVAVGTLSGRLFAIQSGQASVSGKHYNGITGVALSSDGTVCATAGRDGKIRVAGKTLLGQDHITCLYRPAASDVMLSGSEDGRVFARSFPTGAICTKLDTGGVPVTSIGADSRGSRVVASTSSGGLFAWLDHSFLWTTQNHGHDLRDLCVSPNGEVVVGTTRAGELVVWSGEDSSISCSVELGRDFTAVQIGPDGHQLVAGTAQGAVIVWSIPQLLLAALLAAKPTSRWQDVVSWITASQLAGHEYAGWLGFLTAMTDWRRRFEVQISAASEVVSIGEFDIAIE